MKSPSRRTWAAKSYFLAWPSYRRHPSCQWHSHRIPDTKCPGSPLLILLTSCWCQFCPQRTREIWQLTFLSQRHLLLFSSESHFVSKLKPLLASNSKEVALTSFRKPCCILVWLQYFGLWSKSEAFSWLPSKSDLNCHHLSVHLLPTQWSMFGRKSQTRELPRLECLGLGAWSSRS